MASVLVPSGTSEPGFITGEVISSSNPYKPPYECSWPGRTLLDVPGPVLQKCRAAFLIEGRSSSATLIKEATRTIKNGCGETRLFILQPLERCSGAVACNLLCLFRMVPLCCDFIQLLKQATTEACSERFLPSSMQLLFLRRCAVLWWWKHVMNRSRLVTPLGESKCNSNKTCAISLSSHACVSLTRDGIKKKKRNNQQD
jgi:hypothetical protein